jgi:hypothetical protein
LAIGSWYSNGIELDSSIVAARTMKRDPRIRDIFDAAGVGNVQAVKNFLAAGVHVKVLDA